MSPRILAGVDGCPGGWVAVTESGGRLGACVYPNWVKLMQSVGRAAVIAVDIPIGLPTSGARRCDLEARRYLGVPRGSSVFPTPMRACITPGSYDLLGARCRRIDGRGLSKQAFNLLPKIREIDQYLLDHPRDRSRIHEVHPEVSFAAWNDGHALVHRKTCVSGRRERERLIDMHWNGKRERLWALLQGNGCRRDDFNDALAALWTGRRIASGIARRLPSVVELDERGLRMEIAA
jgi:predicted RNase H-like nuclease